MSPVFLKEYAGIHSYIFSTQPPPYLPVIVFWKDLNGSVESSVIQYSSIDLEKAKHPDLSFLCPKGFDPLKNISTDYYEVHRAYSIIKSQGNDFQNWQVSISLDIARFKGEYRAYKDKIVPHSYQTVGPMTLIASLVWYISIFSITLFLLFKIMEYIIRYYNTKDHHDGKPA